MATSRQPSPASSTRRLKRVRFRKAAEEREQGRFDQVLDRVDVDRRRRPRAPASCRAARRGPCRIAGRGDAVGPLVDDAEAEIFEQRHALRERQRRAARKDLQVDAGLVVAFAADRDRRRGGAASESCSRMAMSTMACLGAEGLAIGGAEGVGIAGRERAGARARRGVVERLAQGVGPGADDGGDALLERLARRPPASRPRRGR